MTLRDVLKRLEAINDAAPEERRELRDRLILDIEMYLLRTEGRL